MGKAYSTPDIIVGVGVQEWIDGGFLLQDLVLAEDQVKNAETIRTGESKTTREP